MALNHYKPAKTTASAALLLAGSLFCVPALGATPHHILCSESDSPTLEVRIESLTADIVSHEMSVSHIEQSAESDVFIKVPVLEPRARKAVRNAFEDKLIETAAEEVPAEPKPEATEVEEAPPRVMNTRLPGVTQEKMDRYKRQMFRRDI